MKTLHYHGTIISDEIPDNIDTISGAFRHLGYEIYKKSDICRLHDKGIPGILFFNGVGVIMDYLGYGLK